MQNNYYFLCQLTKELQPKLVGLKLMECFSQEKDELVFEFAAARGKINNYRPFFIKSIIYPDFACLYFPEDFDRKKKNSIDLFSELIDLEVIGVRQFLNERAFAIQFENGFSVVFKIFGNRSNVILFQDDEAIDMFHSRIVVDKAMRISQLDRNLDQSFESYIAQNKDYKKLFPTFGKIVNGYLDDISVDWEILQETLHKLENPTFYLINYEHEVHLSLLPVGEVLKSFENAIEAINSFYIAFTKTDTLEKEKAVILRRFNKEKRQTEAYLKDVYARLELVDKEVKNEEIGHILMANLHQIPERIDKVELFDFYRNKPIIIKLKSDVSPQKNAENYYRKAKNEKIEVDKLLENIDVRENLLKEIQAKIAQVESIQSIRELRNYVKKEKPQSKFVISKEIFKRFEFGGFEILVGRNAKNNDILTQQFAFKEDLWLHARDVSGSHVIVKYQAGRNFPNAVIEKAASIAAFYSKRKTDSLAPVIVTKKKYVRKTKDLAEGQVIVDKEEVVMVVPSEG